jgi:CHAD domain-containing protein
MAMILSAHTSNGGPTVVRPEPLSTRGMLKLLRKRLRNVQNRGLKKNRDGVRDVHRLRVATRRARAALTVCSPLIPKSTSKQIEESLKSQRKALGQLRDWDVLISCVLCTPADENAESRCDLLYFLASQRRSAWKTALKIWSDSEHSALLDDAISEIRASKPRRAKNQSARELFHSAVGAPLETIRAVVRCAEAQAASPDIDSLHDLRIALKELRYLLEFRDEVTQSQSPAPQLAVLIEAQQRLGDLHDLSRRADLLTSATRPKNKSVRQWITSTAESAESRLKVETARYLAWQQDALKLGELQDLDV